MIAEFGRQVRAEWTKLRTVPGWVFALLVAAVAVIGLGLAPGMSGSCGTRGPGSECKPPIGPGGEMVSDGLYLVAQPLAGDGSITVRVATLTGAIAGEHGKRPGLVPWAKAGLIMKASTTPGSAYAAVMLTGSHGVRMQSDFTGDIAGPSDSPPRWLRLTRNGDRVTGASSADGTTWITIGTVRVAGLPSTAQAGLFVASPDYTATAGGPFGLSGVESGPAQATATFDHLARQGQWTASEWTGTRIGGPGNGGPFEHQDYQRSGDTFTVSGSGDIAPLVTGAAGLGVSITQTLVGTFLGLVAIVVVGALFVTGEYRRGLIRTTIAARPRRGLVLAAKATVVGAVSFVVGVVASAVVLAFGVGVLRSHGVYVLPAGTGIELRLVVGTGLLLALSAILALAVGAILRRSSAAVAGVIVLVTLPYLLAVSVLPLGAAQWVLRFSPAAAFAIQQSATQWAQVDNVYAPAEGYFPLPPAAGLGVLVAWTAGALALATVLLRRRDA
ncbi:MAG TPA: ABC transporter permease subunit [Actinoplanes sp.]|jgi:ABC-type transport system involved in multi-copper enzyme maturation permease subunit